MPRSENSIIIIIPKKMKIKKKRFSQKYFYFLYFPFMSTRTRYL